MVEDRSPWPEMSRQQLFLLALSVSTSSWKPNWYQLGERALSGIVRPTLTLWLCFWVCLKI